MQIAGLSVAVVFFALMRQAYAWDYYLPMPSMLTVVEYNLQMPFPFLLLAILPILVSLFHSFLMSQPFPPIMSFAVVSLICYVLANGLIALLILVSQLVFYVTATAHVFIKTRLVGSLFITPCETEYSDDFFHMFFKCYRLEKVGKKK